MVLTRFSGFLKPHSLTFDESLYAQIGLQLKENPANYTSFPIYKHSVKQGRRLPNYLKRPLLKHPPLYSYLISGIYYLAARPGFKSAWSVSLVSGLLLIILVYLLGQTLYDRRTGLLAALLLCLDPIHWLCTQKIWMETTLAVFMCLALLFIVKGAKERNYKFFYWAGAATGCAVLTKYTAFLIFPIGLTLIFIYNKAMLKSKHFWSWPLISFLFFTPWVFWNYKVYGAGFLTEMTGAHRSVKLVLSRFGSNWQIWLLIFLLGLFFVLLFRQKEKFSNFLISPKACSYLPVIVLVLLFLHPYMMRGLLNMFNLSYIPLNGWIIGIFKHEPWCFYLRRILELSPFYIFSFGSILFLIKPKKDDKALIASSVWILTAAIIWRSYQCRYILAVVPFLLLLSSRTIIWLWLNLKRLTDSKMYLLIFRIIFAYTLFMCLSKTIIIDLFLALPNKTCYF